MSRIPDDELERIKREVLVTDLALAQGLTLRRHGADLIGLCPFHDDREPSLVVSPDKNLWHCLGACQAGGGPIDWVMRAQGVSFRHAVETLRVRIGGGAGPEAGRFGKALPKLVDQPPGAAPMSDAALMNRVVSFYHRTLLGSPEALDYLAERGLGSDEAVAHFELGYANRTLSYRLPSKQSGDGEELRQRLGAFGILRESGHEHFRGSLVVPIRGEGGEVVGLYGRKTGKRVDRGAPAHLYLPGPLRGVWNREGLAQGGEVILCEALLDALTFWCAGFRQVTASYGVGGFLPDHLEAFRSAGIERVLIAYDADKAGDEAARELSKRLGKEGFGCWRLVFPKGMDANEYALKLGPAAKALGLVIDQAVWMGEGPAPSRHAGPQTSLQRAKKGGEPLEAPPLAAPSRSIRAPGGPERCDTSSFPSPEPPPRACDHVPRRRAHASPRRPPL